MTVVVRSLSDHNALQSFLLGMTSQQSVQRLLRNTAPGFPVPSERSRLRGHGDHGIAERFRLRPESSLGTGAKAPFVLAEDRVIVRFTLRKHVKYDARQFVRSCRNRRWRPQLGPHAAEKVAERGFTP